MRRTSTAGNERRRLDDCASHWVTKDRATLKARYLDPRCRHNAECQGGEALADRAGFGGSGGPRFAITAAMANRAGELTEVSLEELRRKLRRQVSWQQRGIKKGAQQR